MSDSALLAGRAAAERRMTSTCTVMRPTGDTTTAANGLEVPEWATVYTDLSVRLAGASKGASSSLPITVGSVEVRAARREASFPHDATDLQDRDLVVMTSGDSDGLVLRILEADWADQQTARRVPVEATRRPAEWDA